MKRHIFISYTKKDSDFAWKLADDLMGAGHKVWIDRSLQVGQDWESMIEKRLEDSNEILVILSEQSVHSKWVMHEGSMAYAMKKALYPIVIDEYSKNNLPIWAEKTQFHSFSGEKYEESLEKLIAALKPPNPLQDILDMQVEIYKDTGETLGGAMLEVLQNDIANLIIEEDARKLLDESISIQKKKRNRNRLFAGLFFSIFGILIIAMIIIVMFFNIGKFAVQVERAERLAALSQLTIEEDKELAILLAIQGYIEAQTEFTESSLRQVIEIFSETNKFADTDLISESCQLAGRNFTLEEWKEYIGIKEYEATCPQYPSPLSLGQ